MSSFIDSILNKEEDKTSSHNRKLGLIFRSKLESHITSLRSKGHIVDFVNYKEEDFPEKIILEKKKDKAIKYSNIFFYKNENKTTIIYLKNINPYSLEHFKKNGFLFLLKHRMKYKELDKERINFNTLKSIRKEVYSFIFENGLFLNSVDVDNVTIELYQDRNLNWKMVEHKKGEPICIKNKGLSTFGNNGYRIKKVL